MQLLSRYRAYPGFTLVELVMTILIIGIISASALPKFFNISVYQQRVFFDDMLNAVRYAQKLAVGTACNVQLLVSANQFKISRPGAADRSQCASTIAANYTLAVTRPGSSEVSYQGGLADMVMTDAIIYFTAKGYASGSADIRVGKGQIIIVQSTGFVYGIPP